MNCYGTTQYGKMQKCLTCQMAQYCQSAKEPHSYALEFNESYNQKHEEPLFTFFDDIEEKTSTPPVVTEHRITKKSHPMPTTDSIGFTLRELVRTIISITRADPIRTFIIVGRIGGLTQLQIARTCGMTKQAISKHCQTLFGENEQLRHFLKISFEPDPLVKNVFTNHQYDVRRNNGRRK